MRVFTSNTWSLTGRRQMQNQMENSIQTIQEPNLHCCSEVSNEAGSRERVKLHFFIVSIY